MTECVRALRALRFGYAPYAPGGISPGDRRRFLHLATDLGLTWELYRPGEIYDVLFVTSNADLTHFRRWPGDRTKIVFEMVDSYLSVPDWDAKNLLRGTGKWALGIHRHFEPFYRRTLQGICRRADLVVCSTPEQKVELAPWNRNVHDILDFQVELKTEVRTKSKGDRLELFWEGLGLSASQFGVVGEVLLELSAEYPLRLHLVTEPDYLPINLPIPRWSTRKLVASLLGGIDYHLADWNLVTVCALAANCDLGIIPIHLGQPLFGSKPENKLLGMWRLGLPTVVSATPAYARTMAAYGGPNWACRTSQDWYQTLRTAFTDAELRAKAAQTGADYAERGFGQTALTSRWLSALETLL